MQDPRDPKDDLDREKAGFKVKVAKFWNRLNQLFRKKRPAAENQRQVGGYARHRPEQASVAASPDKTHSHSLVDFELKMNTLQQENLDLRRRQEYLQQQIQQSKKLATTLRGIIMNHRRDTIGPEILDDDILFDFRNLHSQIQRIVMTLLDTSIGHRCLINTEEVRCFKDHLERGLDSGELSNRLRNRLFYYLNSGFLSASMFGMDLFEKDGQVEQGLRKFEAILLTNYSEEHEQEIREWRRLTRECAQWILEQKSLPSPSSLVADTIVSQFQPLVEFHPSDETNIRKFEDQVTELCTSAFNFSKKLRKLKYVHKFEYPKSGSILDEEEAEAFARERNLPGRNVEGHVVVYALLPALVRYTPGLNKRIILQKARVVVYG